MRSVCVNVCASRPNYERTSTPIWQPVVQSPGSVRECLPAPGLAELGAGMRDPSCSRRAIL